jgi:hypothetical protein
MPEKHARPGEYLRLPPPVGRRAGSDAPFAPHDVPFEPLLHPAQIPPIKRYTGEVGTVRQSSGREST